MGQNFEKITGVFHEVENERNDFILVLDKKPFIFCSSSLISLRKPLEVCAGLVLQ